MVGLQPATAPPMSAPPVATATKQAVPTGTRNDGRRVSTDNADLRGQLCRQLTDADVDGIADHPHLLKGSSRGVVELPVEVALARIQRTGVATAHRDDHV